MVIGQLKFIGQCLTDNYIILFTSHPPPL